VAAVEERGGTRRDARRNRARIVAAARDLYAGRGADAVSTRDVARRAGVGVGTLYRHFATKDDLLDAVLEEAFEEIVALAEAALADADAWRGLRRFVEDVLVRHARNRGLKDVVETSAHGAARADAARRRLRPLLAQLVERAQAQGTLRPDFSPQDVGLLFWSSDRVLELTAAVAPDLWRRHLGFLLDGLRAPAVTPAAARPLSEAQLRRIGAGRREERP
jgi:AcrR family transcriptional regulator